MYNLFVKFLLVAIALLAMNKPANSQYQTIAAFPCYECYFSTDKLQNLYICRGKEILKYDNNGKIIATYTNKWQSPVSSMDISDPFKVMLFYRNFNQIVFLDKTLVEISGVIQLNDLNLGDIQAVCTSASGGFWIFNPFTYNVEQYDATLRKVQQTQELTQIVDGEVSVQYMIEQNSKLFVHLTTGKLLGFDMYGIFDKEYDIKKSNCFQIANNSLYYVHDSLVQILSLADNSISTLSLPTEKIICLRVEQDRLYVQTMDSITIFCRE